MFDLVTIQFKFNSIEIFFVENEYFLISTLEYEVVLPSILTIKTARRNAPATNDVSQYICKLVNDGNVNFMLRVIANNDTE